MTRTHLRLRACVASLAVAATVAVAGCGNQNLGSGYADGSSSGPTYAHEALTKDQLMRAAYAAATKAGSAHVTLSVTRKTTSGTTCSCMRAYGDVTFGRTNPAMALTVVQHGRRVDMRFLEGVVYLQIPGLMPRSTFLAVDPHDKKSALARNFAGLVDDMDPSKSFADLGPAVQSAERVGKQTIQGTTVEHYKATIETASLLRKAGYAGNAGGMPSTLDYDLWLDQANRIRHLTFTAQGMTYDETMSRWGEAVKVQRPRPHQLVSLRSLRSAAA